MASILVYIELVKGKATEPCLGILNEGRRIASDLGATLYAMLPCAELPNYDDDDIIAVLSRHGADKVLLLTHPDLDEDPAVTALDPAIRFACQRITPRLVLLPANPCCLELAPLLALQLQGQYCEMGRPSREVLACTEPLVMTLEDAPPPGLLGDEEAEVVVLRPPLP